MTSEYNIPSTWKLHIDPINELAWYELEERPLFRPVRDWYSNFSPAANQKAVELLMKHQWTTRRRWDWFKEKWSVLFEDGWATFHESMGVFFRLPNGIPFHICGKDPEETDATIEGVRCLFGSEGIAQPLDVPTPFDHICEPLFDGRGGISLR